jgi:bifunctional DNase/RNase
MKKIELEVIALSDSTASGNTFAIVLGEKSGNRRMPVIIGAYEAQAIAIALEQMKPARPLTHDLFKNFGDAFQIRLEEIVINDLREGVFYARLVCRSADLHQEIDARTSDAIALAIRYQCPIYSYEHILEAGGIYFDQDGENKTPTPAAATPGSQWQNNSLEELEKQLEEALQNEDYERAAKIRDEIDRRKSS